MKKILLGSSALTLATAATTGANAAEWNLDWGGYYEASLVLSGGTDGAEGIDVLTDSEIIFTPSITLDNGIKFGVNVQLEAGSNTNGDQIDESYIFVKGSFGEVLIGSENSAGYKMSYGAPDVTWINVNSSSTSAFVITGHPAAFRTPAVSSFVEVDGNNDAERITYFTPRFSGFQLGVSYAQDGSQTSFDGVDSDSAGQLVDIFDIGANYVNSFGGFDVALAGRFGFGTLNGAAATAPSFALDPVTGLVVAVPGTAATADDDVRTWAVGVNLGFSGVTIGGSYSDEDGGNPANDGNFYDLGISYGTGPWEASATYAHSDLDSGAEQDSFLVGANYKLGPGVKAGVYGAYVDANAADGWGIGAGFKLNF